MIVRFEKQGERRYSTIIVRDDGRELRMDPSPGFDEFMPHDLQHFIVERAFGLESGVFGQVAVGGTAGTFRGRDINGSKRERSRRHLRRKSLELETFAKSTLEGMTGDERECYTTELLEEIRHEMDLLSAQWRADGSVEVEW